ncbi:uncharacterized protein LOC101239033 isoform X7 [Hydra vulgaris]|uniref:receptor protein-tyrosine kinase n=1 Tax=Hydra vulgaris TaxID=6087 RepID=A0ABM4C7W5_HYDVU
MVKCSRFDEREKTSTTILNMIGFITIDNLAPSTKYKCKLEVYKLSVGLDTSHYVYAKTLIGEACIQPVGFETGIIKEDSIASSSPLGSKKKSLSLYDAGGFWCLVDSQPYIRIDLGRIMTIAGLLFRTNNEAVDKIYIRYGIYNINDMEDLHLDKEGRTDTSKRTFDYPKNDTARYWFLENSFTVKLLEFRPLNDKKPFCVQVEVYGCSENKNPWYQICFPVILTVSAIAVQGQGYHQSAYITEYSIEYGYSANTVSYIYSFNGLRYRFNGTKNRYATSVNHFPVEVSAQCLRIVNITYFISATGRFEVLGDKISYPPNITIPKHVFNIKNSTAIVKCVVIGQPGLLIQWRKQNEIIVDNKVNYTIVTYKSSSDVNGTYTSELEIKPLVHLNVDNDGAYCHGYIKNVSCFFNYSICTGYALSNLFVTNTTLIYYGFDAEIDLPSLTIFATNISINIKWATERIRRDFQVFYNFLLIEHDGYNNIIRDYKTSIENIVVYDAKPNTSYTFQLTAFNRLGIFQKVIKNFFLDECYPSVIGNFTALATFKENISLNWNHPKCQNGIITNYTVEYAEFNLPSTMVSFPVVKENLKNQKFAVVVGKLKNYQKYKFRVNVLTNHGKNSGEWSEWIVEATLEGNPSVIRNLTALAISKENILLKWHHPEIPNGIITNYIVEYGEFHSSNITSLSILVFKSHFDMHTFAVQVKRLNSYQKYKFRVNALTNHGLNPGEWCEWIDETTFEGNPSIVRNFTASAISKENIALKWHRPEFPNGIITNYTVEYGEFDSSNITSLSFTVFKNHSDTRAVQFEQLKNYQKYRFRVKALTNHGMNHGEWSEWVDETTFEGTPSVPEDLIGHASSTRSIKLEWTKPRQLNGIVRSYAVVYSGFKAYSLSFKHTGEIVVYSTKVTISSLFPGTKYTICVNAETIVKGPSSMINITLSYDEPLAPLLKLENQNSEQRTIVLHSVPSFTGPISHYEFDIQENFNYCLNNSNTTFKFLSTLEQNQLVIAKGEENITFQTSYIHLSLVGKFRICYRAVINDSGFVYMGAMSYLDFERNDLAKIKNKELNVGFNSISLRLSKGPLSTKYYQIIVFKGNPINRDPSPSELKPYSEKSDIYLAAEFNASEFMYYENFVVGDGSTYKRFRNAYSNFYKNAYDVLQNVKLQNDKSYSILQRAYEHETKYYSTPWLLNIQTDKMPIKSIKKVGTSIGVIGAVIGTAVCVILLLAVLGILLKRRKKQVNKIKKEEEGTNLVPLKPVSSFKNPSLDIVDENLDKDKRQFFDKEQPSDDHSRMCLGNSSDVKTNYINASVIHGYTKHVYTANKDVKDGWIYENIYDSKDIVKKEGFKNPFNTEERETELDPKRLRLEHELGQGNFGSVVKGVYMLKNNKYVAVAVKTLKEEDIPGQKSEIVKEAEIMSKLDHPNIVRLIGVTQSPGFMLVMELAPQGPLHKFLEKNRKMKVLDILVLMLQVDEGMNYLESQHFIHRDLAARNVLVVSKNFVKISDFGMSRAMGVGNEYYRAEQAGRWPLKWYAPECIYYHKFSSKGDVWSYGITMWEAVSYGGKPYQGMIGSIVIAKLESGYRLPKPDNCSDVVYTLMLKCWETNPDDRPSFMEIGIILSQYIQNERVNKK